jgi:LPXTG-motif cell wall-anchored protein
MNPTLVLSILAFVLGGLYILRRRSRMGRRMPKF